MSANFFPVVRVIPTHPADHLQLLGGISDLLRHPFCKERIIRESASRAVSVHPANEETSELTSGCPQYRCFMVYRLRGGQFMQVIRPYDRSVTSVPQRGRNIA
jgi:hypothetical protein